MSTPGPIKHQYGDSTDLFVDHAENEGSLVVGGNGQGNQPWSSVLTRHAAQVLWFKLTGLLYPDKSERVTALAVTAPLRPLNIRNVTRYIEAFKSGSAYSIIGWMQQETWMITLSEYEARRLWTQLDEALYPVGWEGRQTRPGKLN
jgi:hypothetical protein